MKGAVTESAAMNWTDQILGAAKSWEKPWRYSMNHATENQWDDARDNYGQLMR